MTEATYYWFLVTRDRPPKDLIFFSLIFTTIRIISRVWFIMLIGYHLSGCHPYAFLPAMLLIYLLYYLHNIVTENVSITLHECIKVFPGCGFLNFPCLWHLGSWMRSRGSAASHPAPGAGIPTSRVSPGGHSQAPTDHTAGKEPCKKCQRDRAASSCSPLGWGAAFTLRCYTSLFRIDVWDCFILDTSRTTERVRFLHHLYRWYLKPS